MKKLLPLAFSGVLFLAVSTACGSSSKAHCEAYGDASTTTIEHDDLAQK
jgi:hypothetical protein